MNSSRILPPAPIVHLDLVEELSPPQPPGFCRLVRRRLTARTTTGAPSAAFVYDWVERHALDAVVVAAYFFDAEGRPRVYLRSCTRPPVAQRDATRLPRTPWLAAEGLWEFAAGLVEVDEQTEPGVVECARRELEEELGFSVEPSRVLSLGPSTLPAPGVIGERHFFFRVEVDPAERREPSLDGSALERLGEVIDVSLSDALRACMNGEIEDAKTEIALRRLAETLGHRS